MGSLVFNADEVFSVARQIERNGATFYRRAGDHAAGAAIRDLMLELAAMEDLHERVFATMQEQLTPDEREETLLDPHGEAFAFFGGMGNRYVFDVQQDPAGLLKTASGPADILNRAIGLEKDSIVFYEGIRVMVSAKRGADKLDDIIRQELGHIALLSNRLPEFSRDI